MLKKKNKKNHLKKYENIYWNEHLDYETEKVKYIAFEILLRFYL